jgi:hypothetical protein
MWHNEFRTLRGWNRHTLFVMIAQLFLRTLQLEQKKSAPATLAMAAVRGAAIARAAFTQALSALCWHVARNRAAFLSYRKRRLMEIALKC